MLHHQFLQGTSPSVLVATYRHQLKIKVSNVFEYNESSMLIGLSNFSSWLLGESASWYLTPNNPRLTQAALRNLKWKRDPVQAPQQAHRVHHLFLSWTLIQFSIFVCSPFLLCLEYICLAHQKLCPTFTYTKICNKVSNMFLSLGWPRIWPCSSSSSWFQNGRISMIIWMMFLHNTLLSKNNLKVLSERW